MHINSISATNQAFNGCFSRLENSKRYSPQQKEIVSEIFNYLCSDEGEQTNKTLEALDEDVVILAKPKGTRGITLQAFLRPWNLDVQWYEWYDKIDGCGNDVTENIKSKKDCKSVFADFVNYLRRKDKDGYLTALNLITGEDTPQRKAPKVIDLT